MPIYRKVLGYEYSKMVVLPKHWLSIFDIKKGDSLQISQTDDGNLLIHRPQNEIKTT